mmetsp:Transcript_76206/g.93576  ORF Transcript_76206/g.93576 Transcript_76206/m.93576 type:complete len:255 (-) Transcript_76206:59-823(-)
MGFQDQVQEVLKPLEGLNVASCDTSGIVMVSILCLLCLAVCFFGYRIYRFAFSVFAFLVGFGLQAAAGSAWIAQDRSDSNEITQKVVVVVFAILWGTLFLLLARRYYERIQKILGYVVGVVLGVALTIVVIYLLQKPVDNLLENKFDGWQNYAAITLGVPIALLTGYGCRNWVKFLVMLVTAFGGAAGAWRWGSSLLECKVDASDKSWELLQNHLFNVAIFVTLGLLGTAVQCFSQPKEVSKARTVAARSDGEP